MRTCVRVSEAQQQQGQPNRAIQLLQDPDVWRRGHVLYQRSSLPQRGWVGGAGPGHRVIPSKKWGVLTQVSAGIVGSGSSTSYTMLSLQVKHGALTHDLQIDAAATCAALQAGARMRYFGSASALHSHGGLMPQGATKPGMRMLTSGTHQQCSLPRQPACSHQAWPSLHPPYPPTLSMCTVHFRMCRSGCKLSQACLPATRRLSLREKC